jgi:hypothetical protein
MALLYRSRAPAGRPPEGKLLRYGKNLVTQVLNRANSPLLLAATGREC